MQSGNKMNLGFMGMGFMSSDVKLAYHGQPRA